MARFLSESPSVRCLHGGFLDDKAVQAAGQSALAAFSAPVCAGACEAGMRRHGDLGRWHWLLDGSKLDWGASPTTDDLRRRDRWWSDGRFLFSHVDGFGERRRRAG